MIRQPVVVTCDDDGCGEKFEGFMVVAGREVRMSIPLPEGWISNPEVQYCPEHAGLYRRNPITSRFHW